MIDPSKLSVGVTVYLVSTHCAEDYQSRDYGGSWQEVDQAEVISFDSETACVWVEGARQPSFVTLGELYADSDSAQAALDRGER